MSLQNVLNQTALIAGGPLLAGRAGVYSGAGAITAAGKAIKIAYSLLPDDQSLGEDGLVHISCYGGTHISGGDGDVTRFDHRIRMQLLISMARSTLPQALAILTPFVEAYRDAFAGHVLLNGACVSSRLVDIIDPVNAVPLYANRAAFEFILEATEKLGVAYAA